MGRRPFAGAVADAAAELGARALTVASADVTDALIARAHHLGLRIIAWTVNDTREMTRLAGRGVDGIATDRPDRLRAALSACGLALPPRAVENPVTLAA